MEEIKHVVGTYNDKTYATCMNEKRCELKLMWHQFLKFIDKEFCGYL
jgi:hypothetical protein